jgi:hypothetical protein
MDNKSFNDFLSSSDTLRIYKDDKLIFSSKKNMLAPLIEYIDTCKNGNEAVLILDKMVGNAAALLAVHAGGKEVMSPVGSEIAVKTLDRFGLKYHLVTIVPQVKSPAGGN